MEVRNISLLLNIPLLLIGFFLLNRGAGMLVDGASSIARRLKLPETLIGFTVIALGTSLPKLFTVFLAAYNGYFDLAVGTIIGSCIFNLLGVLSIAGFFRPIRSNRYTALFGLFGLIFSTVLVYVVANYNYEKELTAHIITKKEASLLCIAFVLFMIYGYYNVKKHHAVWFTESETEHTYYPVWIAVILSIVGILGLVSGGVLCVDNLVDISQKFHLPQRFLGQFILSVGGSFVMLYWILTTKTNQSKFEVSNLVGQNMLNLLAMLGIAAFIQPVLFNASFNIDLFILIGVTALLMVMLWLGKKLTLNIWKCRILFLLLLVYITYLFVR